MAPEPLAIVEESKRKCLDFSTQSDDFLGSVISRGHDVVSLVLKDADHRRISNALGILQLERSNSLALEENTEPSVRSLMYGAVESYYLALAHLVEKMHKEHKDELTQTEEIPAVISIATETDIFTIKEDEVVEVEQGPPEVATNQSENLDSVEMDNISTVPTFCHSFPLYKQELIDPSENQSIPTDTLISPKESEEQKVNIINYSLNIKKEEITKEEILDDCMVPPMGLMEHDEPVRGEVKEENDANEETPIPVEDASFNDIADNVMDGTIQSEMFDNYGDSIKVDMIEREGLKKKKKIVIYADAKKVQICSETKKSENGKRSSRRISKPLKYVESDEDSDDEEGLLMNKSKSECEETNGRKRKSANEDISHKSVSGEKKARISKLSGTELKCLECEYRTYSVSAWVSHLRYKHSTTLSLSGYALRCACGHEGFSEDHSYYCDISNFTVVRKRDGPIRRLDDAKETPQCVLCEMYPKSANGYVRHLYEHHKSSLVQNGIYLKCGCGSTVRYESSQARKLHAGNMKCDGRRYTLHKIADQ